jgi:hypothetical protein
MSELTIVSPHRDDVPFSLCLSLWRWRSLPVKLNVVTVFTVSLYAPRATVLASDFDTARSIVRSLRKREDRRAFNLIDKTIGLEDLDLLDAPLRLGITADLVCKPQQSLSIESRPEVETLSRHFRKYFLRGLVLAPLALGDHIDHLAVRAAAIRCCVPHKLGFYEDLPYATWVSESSLRTAVAHAEHSTGVPLKSSVIRRKGYTSRKRGVVSRYPSQISPNEANAISRFAANYGCGERIWFPKHSRSWRSLIRESHV